MSQRSTSETIADRIVALERAALDRWGSGDPGGFLDVYADDITYFDPATAQRLDGHQVMTDYYRPWTGKIHIARYELVNPRVVAGDGMAVLSYNLVNYLLDDAGVEQVGTRWNATTVFQQRAGVWKAVHSHWSFTRHPALQAPDPVQSEGLAREGSA